MTCKIVLEIKVQPEHVGDVLETIGEQLPETRDREGCLEVYAYQDQDDPTTIVAIQEWETRAQYEEYFAWRGTRGDLATLQQWLTQPISLRFFDKKA